MCRRIFSSRWSLFPSETYPTRNIVHVLICSRPNATRPFSAAATKDTFRIRTSYLTKGITFACALETIHSSRGVPDRWQFPVPDAAGWVEFVDRLSDDLWSVIRDLKAILANPGARDEVGRDSVGAVWSILWAEHTNPQQSNWDMLMERFVFATSISPKSKRSTLYQFQQPGAMASTESHLTWLARSIAVFGYLQKRNELAQKEDSAILQR